MTTFKTFESIPWLWGMAISFPEQQAAAFWRRSMKDPLHHSNISLATGSTGGFRPASFSLKQNYPNPFNPTTQITFEIAEFEPVQLKVYDPLGREVKTLMNAELNAGSYVVTFDASGFASCVYMCRMQSGNYAETRRMILLR